MPTRRVTQELLEADHLDDSAQRFTQVVAEVDHVVDRAQRFTQVVAEVDHVVDRAQRFTQVLIEVDVNDQLVFTHGVAMPGYEGDARGKPLPGDRSAWEVDDYPRLHASDLNDEEPRRHNPWPMSSGYAAVSDGDKLVATDVATQAELDAHEGQANPHGTELGDLADVDVATDPPEDGDGLVWDEAGGEWVPGSTGGVVSIDVTAGVNLSAGDLVNLYNNGGGKARLADASLSRPVHGFVEEAVTSGNTATVILVGVIEGLSGMTPGATQYLGDDGAATETAPTAGIVQEVGVAASATEMTFAPKHSIVLAT